jgi:sigma-B regulation protein RsbU (phosphoserine phosphatase)
VVSVTPEAQRAGLRRGDIIVAIKGKAFHDQRMIADAFNLSGHPTPFSITVTHAGDAKPHSLTIPALPRSAGSQRVWEGLVEALLTLMPLACTVIGVYVAALIPYDFRAITVFGLMISTSQIVEAVTWVSFVPSLRALAFEYTVIAVTTWGLCLVLFALYFPHRFPWDIRRPWIKWLLIGPLILFAIDESLAGSEHFWGFDAL